ncbi:MAG TPA: hypothetical protein VH560_13465 [Polyangia bacterium]|jgi:hypothetical protein|nr:hypothetical protein [Polyangia bacterium]
MRDVSLMLLALAGATTSLACSDLNAPLYFNGPTPLLELQGTEKVPRITNGVSLRFRAPTSDEKKSLSDEAAALKAADPMHRTIDVPWVSRDKIHLELLFTVKNLDTMPGTFDVTVDGANQYTKYDENVVAAALGQGNDNAPVYLPLLSLHPLLPQTLAAGGVYQGVLREDDFDKAELYLDAMGRWMAPFATVLLDGSSATPQGLGTVPADIVLPALVEVDVTLTADHHMTCEWVLRVRDDDDRLWHVTGDPLFQPKPTLFEPMLPPKT